MFVKSVVVIACCVLSGFGVVLLLFGLAILPAFGWLAPLVLVSWLLAMSAFADLALKWIAGVRLGRRKAVIACVVGVAGVLVLPSAALLSGRESSGLVGFVGISALELVAVLPAVLLAVYLAQFHAQSIPVRSDPQNEP